MTVRLIRKNYYKYFLASCIRMLRITRKFPKASLVYMLTYIPTVWCKREHDKTHREFQTTRRENKEAKGWAAGKKTYAVYVKNKRLAEFVFNDPREINLLEFYLFRTPAHIIEAFARFDENNTSFQFNKNMKIFEPGCNSGKLLLFLKDVFSAQTIGMDIHQPAIDVANTLIGTRSSSSKFMCADVLHGDYLEQYKDSYFDLTVLSNHLCHINHYGIDVLRDYFRRIFRISKQVYINDIFFENFLTLYDEVAAPVKDMFVYDTKSEKEQSKGIHCAIVK